MKIWGWGRKWELGINIYIDTTIYKIDNQQGPTTNHRELCLKFCNNRNGKRIYKGTDICICDCASSVDSDVPYSL
jgi:hypothetical protein